MFFHIGNHPLYKKPKISDPLTIKTEKGGLALGQKPTYLLVISQHAPDHPRYLLGRKQDEKSPRCTVGIL